MDYLGWLNALPAVTASAVGSRARFMLCHLPKHMLSALEETSERARKEELWVCF